LKEACVQQCAFQNLPPAVTNRRRIMPSYQFVCRSCEKRFDIFESVAEHDRHEETCPGCGSRDLRQDLEGIQVRTARKS
jgi:putative FmdB family regulatory protein